MKLKLLLAAALLFFLCLNIQYYVQYYLGDWDLFITFFLLAFFLILGVSWLYQLRVLIRDKFARHSRLYVFILLSVVLGLTVFFPAGIIPYDRLEGENWIIARAEGALNCTNTFRFKTNKRFTEDSVCFGVGRQRGTYTVRNDTLFLSYQQHAPSRFSYGIIKKDSSDRYTGGKLLVMGKYPYTDSSFERPFVIVDDPK